MRKTTSLIVTVITSVLLVTPTADSGGLYAHLEMDKTSFIPYETIYLEYWLDNVSSDSQLYDVSALPVLTVLDDKGEEWQYRGLYADPPPIESLPPGTSSQRALNLILDNCGEGSGFTNFVLPPGSYRAWSKHYPSDTVEFIVRAPANEAEQTIVELYAQAKASEANKSYDESYYAYKRIADQLPSSVIAAQAVRMLTVLCNGVDNLDPAICRDHFCQFLVDYPRSPFVDEAIPPSFEIDWCVEERRDSVLESLDIVIGTFSGTQIAERAKALKERLEAGMHEDAQAE